jgi:hypothetical protein
MTYGVANALVAHHDIVDDLPHRASVARRFLGKLLLVKRTYLSTKHELAIDRIAINSTHLAVRTAGESLSNSVGGVFVPWASRMRFRHAASIPLQSSVTRKPNVARGADRLETVVPYFLGEECL